MPNHSFSEETFPNICPEPVLAQLEAMPELCYSRLGCLAQNPEGCQPFALIPELSITRRSTEIGAGFSLFKASILLLSKALASGRARCR